MEIKIVKDIVIGASLLISSSSMAAIDPAATVVELRKDCGVLDNCFGTMPDLLDWIWGASGNPTPRNPDAASPLEVRIGPGVFGTFNCEHGGHVSLRGSGRTQTTIGKPTDGIGIKVNDCTNLDFSDLLVTHAVGGLFWNILWVGSGTSTWNNVDVEGGGYGWVDLAPGNIQENCTIANRGRHFWFNSRITTAPDGGGGTNSAIGYRSRCGESWFFGSEIHVKNHGGEVVGANYDSEIHVYGSVLRATFDDGVVLSNIRVATTGQNGSIHIHGTGIDAISAEPNDIDILVANGGTIHANETGFNLRTGVGGTITRVKENGGTISSPYSWKQQASPVNITSVTGADNFIETDCDSAGDCDTPSGATHPNLMVYGTSCTTAGTWFNMVTGKCRGE